MPQSIVSRDAKYMSKEPKNNNYEFIENYRGYEIRKVKRGKAKGLIYAENKSGHGIGELYGENSVSNVKKLVDNSIKRNRK